MSRLLRRRLTRFLRGREGTNLVEAALVSPMLFMVTFAIVDFGMIIYAHTALENGVGLATRYAVTGRVIAGETRETSIKEAMRDATPTITIPNEAFTFSHIPAGGATWLAGVGGPNDIGRVQVDLDWDLMTPFASALFTNGSYHIGVESVMRNERFE
jgi:Flp pilus assembly protein TadG